MTRRLVLRLALFALFPLVALFAPLLVGGRGLVRFDPNDVDLDARLAPPGAAHLLGTDELGRDVLARLLHGARVSTAAGFLAATLALGLGSLLGAAAGFFGRGVDRAVLFAVEVFQALPALVLVSAAAAFFPRSFWTASLLVAAVAWPDAARLVRAEARRVASAPFVEAARAAGATRGRLLFVHVLPHALPPALATAPYVLGAAVVAEAALSFLGLGTPPPTASWGRSLADARDHLTSAWWCAAAPALALFLFVYSARQLGDALEERAARAG